MEVITLANRVDFSMQLGDGNNHLSNRMVFPHSAWKMVTTLLGGIYYTFGFTVYVKTKSLLYVFRCFDKGIVLCQKRSA